MIKENKGPKDKPEVITDRYCQLCEKWFNIFQIDRYSSLESDSKDWIYVNVCHGCAQKLVRKALSHKLNNNFHIGD